MSPINPHEDYPVPPEAVEIRFVHASGPGGQHVNKTATAVELRVNITDLGLSPSMERRLRAAEHNRISKDDVLIIQADQYRSQLANRKDAFARLQQMISKAKQAPKRRIATKPSAAAKKRRITSKKLRGSIKVNRRKPRIDD